MYAALREERRLSLLCVHLSLSHTHRRHTLDKLSLKSKELFPAMPQEHLRSYEKVSTLSLYCNFMVGRKN